jgi:hypothetical protein
VIRMSEAMLLEQRCAHAGAFITIAASYANEDCPKAHAEALKECRDRLESIIDEISNYI